MKYPVVASDLDGTLLSPNHDLTSYTKDTLKQLVETQDIHFVFATGRHHVDVAQIRDGLGIDAYMITSNGARIHNTQGEALKQVAGLHGYATNDCIAFGDGMNDKEMLTMAGKGCIMQNAHQLLKDALPTMEVIGSNSDDAVARYLRNKYLSNV